MEQEQKRDRKTVDPAAQAAIDIACELGCELVWDRVKAQKTQCTFGLQGLCCRHCAMGPCRIDPKGKGAQTGICGATAETIAARHFVRMIASGTSAHSDHGRAAAETFVAVAKGQAPGYAIKDEMKLLRLAMDLGVEIGERPIRDIAVEVGERLLADFGSRHGPLAFIKRAPLKRRQLWEEKGMTPRGIDREVVEALHRTTMGVDQDIGNLMIHGSRCALGDGWGGSMIATELQDVMFGSPVPLLGRVNLGNLSREEVNIIIHGHEPLLAEAIVLVSREKGILDYARSKGARGVNLSGICCTANEVLMRHGIAVAGNFLHQELALVTGAVEAMVVDVQCVMQSLAKVASCFHTKLITTNERAMIPGATHIQFHETDAVESAGKIVRAAIDNFPNRKGEPNIPAFATDMVAGFSVETIGYMLGGSFRAGFRPLNDNIINGRIRGVAGVVGCNTPKLTQDQYHLDMVKHLIKNGVLVLTTGCAAMAFAKEGLLLPEAAAKFCSPGLAEVCETVGIPPVLHLGSCVDNSRILMAATAVVKEGGLGDDLSDLPAAGAAPEWMSEKAIAIGQYFVASGVFVVFGGSFPTLGSKEFSDLLMKKYREITGGYWAFEPDPIKAADLMIAHIDERRRALGLDKKKERVLYDMEMRRQLAT
ncbi:MAG: anaerobic carbon-monoxide dehydrogenase catalytic subunit [Myxococcota bacterium]|nr:anaerobic carbon-monoxide dehydrogenase catalytic subunit [Myxococcota bacterium]